jgi:hypothetical protein
VRRNGAFAIEKITNAFRVLCAARRSPAAARNGWKGRFAKGPGALYEATLLD